MTDIYITGATALAACLILLWIISIVRGHVSFIDAFWGTGFLIAAGAGAAILPALGTVQTLALALLAAWSVRLSLYLLKRYLTHGEDPRYVKIIGARTGMNRHIFTLWFVFGMQGVLILIVAAPVMGLLATPARGMDLWAYAGTTLWTVGAFFEWVGDWQLSRFKANPANEGKVMDQGLWALTRHPNYFGDACVWWGLWLIGHDITLVFAPALMTFMLMKWSGVPLLEKSLKKRRPGYADYINRTSAFFPWPPKA